MNFETPTCLEGFTLIIPNISIGNVPQLTIDLLITSLKLNKISTLWHPAIISSVGSDPYNIQSTSISTAGQLYFNEDLKLAVLQFRSQFDRHRIGSFLSELEDAITKFEINNVVILTSLFDYELNNIKDKENIFYISNFKIHDDVLNIGAKVLEENSNGELLIKGTGLASKLYYMIKKKINCTLIVKYVSEGDNAIDAEILLKQLLKFVPIDANIKICSPPSWNCIYGPPPSVGIF